MHGALLLPASGVRERAAARCERSSSQCRKGASSVTRLVIMEGDGIGPEISAATVEVLREADRRFALGLAFTTASVGFTALRQQGTTFPMAAFEAPQSADGVILGPRSHNAYPGAAAGGPHPSAHCRR